MSEIEKFLNSKGWYKWYNDDYYVNRKMPDLLKIQKDHTYLGMSEQDANQFETDEVFRNKYIESMQLGHSALSAFSKLRSNQRKEGE